MVLETIRTWLRGRTMVLNQINQEDLIGGILLQLAKAVAERNYEPLNIQDQEHINNNPNKSESLLLLTEEERPDIMKEVMEQM